MLPTPSPHINLTTRLAELGGHLLHPLDRRRLARGRHLGAGRHGGDEAFDAPVQLGCAKADAVAMPSLDQEEGMDSSRSGKNIGRTSHDPAATP